MKRSRERHIAVVDPLAKYLQEVSRYPMLTDEEEKRLAKLYHEKHDIEAARTLVTTHLRLVIRIAMEYKNAYQNILDLIQEGNVGLLQAVKHFNPDKGARLAYYASWWIRSYILKYILDNFRLIKLGTTKTQRKLFYNLMQEKQKIESMGYVATPAVLSKRLGVKESEVVEMQKRLTQPEFALEAPAKAHAGEGEKILSDFLASDETPIEEKLAREETEDILKSKLAEFANTLNEREVKIFKDRLISELPMTLQDIADEYGITKERVRQLEERIIEKLKTFFKERGIEVGTLSL